jgi:hypothetical protein
MKRSNIRSRKCGSLVVVLLTAFVACGRGERQATVAPTRIVDGNLCSIPGGPTNEPTSTDPARSSKWEEVVTLKGVGPTELQPFRIRGDCPHWRARWTCQSGPLRATFSPPLRRTPPLIDTDCPATGEASALIPGDVRLKIEAQGAWEITIDQQLPSS